MFNRTKIIALLELIEDVVNDDHTPWAKKRDDIKDVASESDRYEVALEEFNAWFEGTYEK